MSPNQFVTIRPIEQETVRARRRIHRLRVAGLFAKIMPEAIEKLRRIAVVTIYKLKN